MTLILFPPQALRSFFPTILSLCENLLCSGSPSVSSFAASLYRHLFITFDVYCQQVCQDLKLSLFLPPSEFEHPFLLLLGSNWCTSCTYRKRDKVRGRPRSRHHSFSTGAQLQVHAEIRRVHQGQSCDSHMQLQQYFSSVLSLQSVLDFVEQLTVPQIRKLYHALSVLSFQQVEEMTSLQDEMHTIIRKQLARSEPKQVTSTADVSIHSVKTNH